MRRLVWVLPLFLLAGCASYYDLGNGKSLRTATTEDRSPFGTNAGFMQLQECQKVVSPQTGLSDYVNCEPRSAWVPMQSQGQGGQVVSGALTGIGFGLGSAFSGAGSVSSSAASSIVTAPAKGGHH